MMTFVRTVLKQHVTTNFWILLFLLNTSQIIILFSLHDHHCISILIFFWHSIPSRKCDICTHVTWLAFFRSEYYKRQKLVYTTMVLSICSFTENEQHTQMQHWVPRPAQLPSWLFLRLPVNWQLSDKFRFWKTHVRSIRIYNSFIYTTREWIMLLMLFTLIYSISIQVTHTVLLHVLLQLLMYARISTMNVHRWVSYH
jgi:hypothetical protein